MRGSPLKAGLVALALMSAVGAAHAGTNATDTLKAAGQVESSPAEISRIRQFLAQTKDISKMKLPRLQQRLHRAEAFREVQGLPSDLDEALQKEVARIAAEIARRQQGEGEPTQPEPRIEDPPLPPYDPQKPVDPQQ